ncbi:hypothetical protein AVEN_217706-1 [Araneus ventricosus]|uniref:Uncharacterized protein n=1 Tax=Araneus ventricosus TaxID=182803 RepID=A0A4Y2TLE1_ARAVE|nr:hypothetical protein AVEN_217706-1 [Araneus ventricosus]
MRLEDWGCERTNSGLQSVKTLKPPAPDSILYARYPASVRRGAQEIAAGRSVTNFAGHQTTQSNTKTQQLYTPNFQDATELKISKSLWLSEEFGDGQKNTPTTDWRASQALLDARFQCKELRIEVGWKVKIRPSFLAEEFRLSGGLFSFLSVGG